MGEKIELGNMLKSLMNIKIKQKWGLLFLLFVAITYILIFFFLNKPEKESITEIYFADRLTVAHKILINKYNKLNEGKVKVIPINFPNIDFSTNEKKEMLARSLRGKGEGIDLFAVDPIWVQRFARWAEPMDNYFSDQEKNRILKSAMESCYYEGQLVALPLNMVQGVLYYRDDLLKEHKNYDEILRILNTGITWDEFIKLKDKIKITTPFYIFPASDYEGLICVFMELLLSLNNKYFEQYGFNFNTAEAQKSLQLLVDLVNKYKTTPRIVTEFTEITSFEYFIKNNGLFIWGWPSYDKDFKEAPYDLEKESHLRKAPVPYFQSGIPTSIYGGWNLMVSKFSNKKEASIDFIKFLLKDESQEIFYKNSGHYPVINEFYDNSEYLKKYPEIETIKKYMEIGKHRPAHINYTKYSKIMAFYIKIAIQNKISVKEALSECTNAIQTDIVMIKEL